MDRDLGNGSILRFDPKTGRSRVISGADAARTALTRERDAELSMQAGAPPIAQGNTTAPAFDPAAESRQRLLSLASARPDRNITPETVARATPEQVRGELSALGTGAMLASRAAAPASGGPLAPARATLAPSDPNNPDSPLAPTAPRAAMAASARPAPQEAPTFRNMAMAAGPNISTAPTGLPAGSIGAQRADGSYTVTLADGRPRRFANEAEARAEFAQDERPTADNAPAPAVDRGQAGLARNGAPFITDPNRLAAGGAAPRFSPPAPIGPRPLTPAAAPDAAGMDTRRTTRAGMEPMAAPAPEPVAVTPIAQPPVIPMGDPRNPIRDVTPAIQSVMAAANQPPTPVATPVNTPRRAPSFGGQIADTGRTFRQAGREISQAVANAAGAPQRNEASRIRSQERSSRVEAEQQRRRMRAPGFRQQLAPDRDAGSVPPIFGDEEPAAFPSFSPTGTNRPRASLA